ncbi:hypothetical protein ABK905_19375 [Acerihabitans sp. KWT182]|uniref:Uncharacterized protein n=1 Tax=Acerihabitans sp. KWT182 TaxID=3157919 RepID=A0AAU7Q725_9GAMM
MANFSSLAAAGGAPLYVLGDARGNIKVTEPVLADFPANQATWTFPFGEADRVLSDDGMPLRHLALAQTDGGQGGDCRTDGIRQTCTGPHRPAGNDPYRLFPR